MEDMLELIKELQSIAQSALYYCKDKYDIGRFERIREISATMMANISDTPLEKIKDLFCNEVGYQTPKIDVRAAIFKEDKILLVQERGLWTMPGGWADIGLSLAQNAAKEALEEAGAKVKCKTLVAVIDKSKRSLMHTPYGIYSFLILCDYIEGEFVENIETTASGYFALDTLPELDELRSTKEQIELCYKAYTSTQWETLFD